MENEKIESPKVKLMKARLKAAELRKDAAHQEEFAAGYFRQAKKPIYAGQEEICTQKGNTVMSLAAKKRAEADLIEAEAEAEYERETGEKVPEVTK